MGTVVALRVKIHLIGRGRGSYYLDYLELPGLLPGLPGSYLDYVNNRTIYRTIEAIDLLF